MTSLISLQQPLNGNKVESYWPTERIIERVAELCATEGSGFRLAEVVPTSDGSVAIVLEQPDASRVEWSDLRPLAALVESIPGVSRVYLSLASLE